MPDRKARRDHVAKIVEAAAASAPVVSIPKTVDFELALRSACLAENIQKDALVYRIMCDWLKEKGYLS